MGSDGEDCGEIFILTLGSDLIKIHKRFDSDFWQIETHKVRLLLEQTIYEKIRKMHLAILKQPIIYYMIIKHQICIIH